jgi:hypothetical protein
MLRPFLPPPGFTSDASSACQLYNSTNNTREILLSQHCQAPRGPNETWPRKPAASRGRRPGNQARHYISTHFARLPALPSFLTTPFGSQIHHKNLKTFFESLEISSRTLSIICASIFQPRHSFRHSLQLFPHHPDKAFSTSTNPPHRSHVQALFPIDRPRGQGCQVEEVV